MFPGEPLTSTSFSGKAEEAVTGVRCQKKMAAAIHTHSERDTCRPQSSPIQATGSSIETTNIQDGGPLPSQSLSHMPVLPGNAPAPQHGFSLGIFLPLT